MLGKPPSSPTEIAPSTLMPSLAQAVVSPDGQNPIDLQIKLRGNILHVLCQSARSLSSDRILLSLVKALLEPELKTRLAQDFPQIYQFFVYSRVAGERQPEWTAPLYLDRLERHLAQLVLKHPDDEEAVALLHQLLGDSAAVAPPSATTDLPEEISSAIVVSNLSLARKGKPDAIARYLSELLSSLDVGVWVSVRAFPGQHNRLPTAVTAVTADPKPGSTRSRLWILCEAAYSPDPLQIAEPTAQRLRELNLTQYRDAALVIQVKGESDPDWTLRVDLTPPEEMLREWSRWGDVPALERLLTYVLRDQGITVAAETKDTTLHLVCTAPATTEESLSQHQVMDVLGPLLESIAPQGLHRAMVFGQRVAGQEATAEAEAAPDWVTCLDLPGAEHDALGVTAEALAQQGDLPALAFVLTRLLNPNLDAQLATGGQRVQLLLKQNLLHVMVDGPVCPQRRQVAPAIDQRLGQLKIPDLSGLRIYGRRAGEQQPSWSFGSDFAERDRIVPEATPEFAASEVHLGDLINDSPEAAEALADDDEDFSIGQLWRQTGQWLGHTSRKLLLSTQLFAPVAMEADLPASVPTQISAGGGRIALVWGFVGLLLLVQADWILGELVRPRETPAESEPEAVEQPPPPQAPERLTDLPEWADLDFGRPEGVDPDDFVASPREEAPVEDIPSFVGDPAEERPLVRGADLLADSPYPSFTSQQMDEKLALYHQRFQVEGPPDVLVVGSSRALRGVDPAALSQALGALGYDDVTVFNFGVNGATAQVVELILRSVLRPDQLPKLVLWADGARAFNSGRVDVTYNAIAVSEGFQALQAGELNPEIAGDLPQVPDELAQDSTASGTLTRSYQAVDDWLNDQIAQWSAIHRDRNLLKDGLSGLFRGQSRNYRPGHLAEGEDPLMANTDLMDVDGFLSLSVRFNPATYYQNHARVPGAYDGDYEDFQLGGHQAEALERLLGFTESQDIPVVFVNTPLTDEYFDAYRSAAETDFLEFMVRFSARYEGFIFRDLGQQWIQEYDYFSDPSHLNRYGALRVSNRVAQDPLIPWPVATQGADATGEGNP
jgi:hypothetical protein